MGVADVAATGGELPGAAREAISGSPAPPGASPILASPSEASGAVEVDMEGSLSPAFLALSFRRFFWLLDRPPASETGADAVEPANKHH